MFNIKRNETGYHNAQYWWKRTLPSTVREFPLGDFTFRTNDTLLIYEKEWIAARQHAELIYGRSKHLYSERHAFRLKKDHMIRQIAYGKAAEIVIQREAVYRNYDVSPVDLKVYTTKELRYEPDLTIEGKRFHVKTNMQNIMGWVASRTDPVVHSPHPDDVFVLCRINETTNQVIIQYVVPRSEVVFMPMRNRLLRQHKICILPKELEEVYMKLYFPTMNYVEGTSIYELNVGIETRQINQNQILSCESYLDDQDVERFRLWYVVPASVKQAARESNSE